MIVSVDSVYLLELFWFLLLHVWNKQQQTNKQTLPNMPSPIRKVIAFSTLLARRLILLEWPHSSPPTHNKWIQETLRCITLEKIRLKGSLNTFYKTWQPFLEHTDSLSIIAKTNWAYPSPTHHPVSPSPTITMFIIIINLLISIYLNFYFFYFLELSWAVFLQSHWWGGFCTRKNHCVNTQELVR